nr:hypothetical protein BDOA9_0142060 [Bradyrhizobium sp. DOA9]
MTWRERSAKASSGRPCALARNLLALPHILLHSLREGDQRMTKLTAACALGTALVLGSLATSGAEARTRKAVVVRAPQERLIVTAPVLRPTPWDYNVVPRYRYRPEDDKVDPYGPPLVPSYVRYEGWRWPYWW